MKDAGAEDDSTPNSNPTAPPPAPTLLLIPADADAGAGAGTGVDIDNVDIGIDEGRDGRELEENDGDRPNIAIFGGPRGGG
mmetsp:Transcript_646/g.835  ORF Transcript_646/g.835 Transcript_646/m.835 type:complete len:81 (-) Transcript_646:17-259(-)